MAYVYFPDGSRREITGAPDMNIKPIGYRPATLEEWVINGWSGMRMSEWLRWGKPRRCAGETYDCKKPPGGAECNAVDEHQYDSQPDLVAEWLDVAPGCRGQYELTLGALYSASAGGFVGNFAPTVAPPTDAAPIVQAPIFTPKPELLELQTDPIPQPASEISPIKPESPFDSVLFQKEDTIDTQKLATDVAKAQEKAVASTTGIVATGRFAEYAIWIVAAVVLLWAIGDR